MWQQGISKILSESGWGSGFRLPISSKENLALEQELERKQREISRLQVLVEDETRHCENLDNILRVFPENLAQQNRIAKAKQQAFAKEKEIQRIAEMDYDRCIQDWKASQKHLLDTKQRNENLCIEIEDRKQKLAELVELIEFDRRELARLEKHAEGGDVYLEMLEELCESDAETLAKYQEKYRAAGEAVALARNELNREVSETTVLQRELEGLSERFRHLHKERGEVIDLWKNVLSSLKCREGEMQLVSEEYMHLKSILRKKELEYESEHNRYEDSQNLAARADSQVTNWDRKLVDIRESIKQTQDWMQQYKDSIASDETSINIASKSIEELKAKAKEIDKELWAINQKIANATAKIDKLKVEADISKMNALTAAEKAKQIQSLVDEEEQRMEEMTKQLDKEMKIKSHWLSKKAHLDNETLNIDHIITSNEKNIIKVREQIKENQWKFEKRRANMYNLEIQAITLASKLKSLINPKQYDALKYQEDEAKVMQMRKAMASWIHNKAFLMSQSAHLDALNRRVYRENTLANQEIDKLEDYLNEVRMRNRSMEKFLDDLAKEQDDLMVTRSLTQLKVVQLQNIIKDERRLIEESEKLGLMIRTALKEKRSELDSHHRLRELQRRTLREEVCKMKVNMSSVFAEIERKKSRYEMSKRLMGSEDGETKSEAYYVLKMAQEKEILKSEGDMWDVRVKELEKETMALQNTLALMTTSNFHMKDSLKPVLDENIQAELEELEMKTKNLAVRKQTAIKETRRLRAELSAKLKELESLDDQRFGLESRTTDREYDFKTLQSDIRNQEISRNRTQVLIQRLLKHLTFAGEGEKALVSTDIKLRLMRRKFEFALKSLVKLLSQFPHLFELVEVILCEKLGKDQAISVLKRINSLARDSSATPDSQRVSFTPSGNVVPDSQRKSHQRSFGSAGSGVTKAPRHSGSSRRRTSTPPVPDSLRQDKKQ